MYRLSCLFLLLIALICLGSTVQADIPQLLSYQGRLLTDSGNVVDDGEYALTFSILDAAVGGNVVWSESYAAVPVVDGLFSVVLGSAVPLSDSVFSSPGRYLTVEVNGEQLSDPVQFTSSGYSFRVGTIDGSKGGSISGGLEILNDAIVSSNNSDNLNSRAADSRIVFAFDPTGQGSLSLFEPVDSKGGFGQTSVKKVEIKKDGIIMFGLTESDTNLFVAPNGDIIGKGQITMGENSSPGFETSVLGFENTANGDSSTIGGGSNNVTNGSVTVISGGYSNTANGGGSTISGGSFNTTGGDFSSIGGGNNNSADGNYATIGGGLDNTAHGGFATVPGGHLNSADAEYTYASGRRAKANHPGSFVWADHTDADFSTTGDDQFIVRASGGVGIGTNTPVGLLDVQGTPGDSSVNLPADAIASPEIMDEPGLTSERNAGGVTLVQGSSTTQPIIQTSITLPADGYVLVRGMGTLRASGTSKQNQAYLQIQEDQDPNVLGPYYVLVGGGDYDTPSSEHYFAMVTERVFMLPAGTHTFTLAGLANPTNNNSAVSIIENTSLTAIYFPTSYGTVRATNSSAAASLGSRR